MAAAGKDHWICGNCNTNYDKDKVQLWLECDCCDRKFDTACLGITKTQHNVMGREDLLWLCPDCIVTWNNFKTNDKGSLIKIMQMNSDIPDSLEFIKNSTTNILKQQEATDKIVQEIQTQLTTNIMNKFDSKLKEIEETITKETGSVITTVKNDVPKLWTDVVKASNPTEYNQRSGEIDMVRQMKRALYEVAESGKEEEIRAKGIVVYKLPEEENDGKEDRVAEDTATLEELVAHLGIQDAKIQYVQRLGQFDAERCAQGKYRPIKVRFNSKEIRDQVLKSLNKLRYAPLKLKALSIRQDLNDMQREELRGKMDTAFRRSRESTTKHYIVKGGPGSYRIIEVAKKYPQTNQFSRINGPRTEF